MESLPWDKILQVVNIAISVLALAVFPLVGFLLKKIIFPKWAVEKQAKFLNVLDTVYNIVEALSAKTAWSGDDKLAEAMKLLHDDLSAQEKELAEKYLAAKALESKKK